MNTIITLRNTHIPVVRMELKSAVTFNRVFLEIAFRALLEFQDAYLDDGRG